MSFIIYNKTTNTIFVNFFLTGLLILTWSITSYIFGRYENQIKNLRRYIFNQSYLIIIVSLLTYFINNIVFYLISQSFYEFFEIKNYLLSIIFIFISEILFLNFKNIKNLNDIENWVFVKNSIESKSIEEILKFSRTKVITKFIELNEIKNLNLTNVNGIVVENHDLLEDTYPDYPYLLKDKRIKILSPTEWAGIILQRYPSEIVNQNNSNFKKIFLNSNFNIFEIRLKRISELLISITLLTLSLPLIILSAILIKIEDGGPIFYTQIRTGYREKTFRIFKIRTMKINSEENGPLWSTKNDKRITKIGNFLRKSRIDELPQLIQVINGKISLIGPRPERPDFDKVLKEKIPNYDFRYLMKPGITGWSQVNYPYGASVKDSSNKLSYDLYYIHNFSILLDLLILFKTIKLVFNRKGAIAQN